MGVRKMERIVGRRIKGIMGEKDVSLTELARRLGYSRQNLSNKFARDNFTEKDIQEISEALGVKYCIKFKDK